MVHRGNRIYRTKKRWRKLYLKERCTHGSSEDDSQEGNKLWQKDGRRSGSRTCSCGQDVAIIIRGLVDRALVRLYIIVVVVVGQWSCRASRLVVNGSLGSVFDVGFGRSNNRIDSQLCRVRFATRRGCQSLDSKLTILYDHVPSAHEFQGRSVVGRVDVFVLVLDQQKVDQICVIKLALPVLVSFLVVVIVGGGGGFFFGSGDMVRSFQDDAKLF